MSQIELPEGFTPHPRVKPVLERRAKIELAAERLRTFLNLDFSIFKLTLTIILDLNLLRAELFNKFCYFDRTRNDLSVDRMKDVVTFQANLVSWRVGNDVLNEDA